MHTPLWLALLIGAMLGAAITTVVSFNMKSIVPWCNHAQSTTIPNNFE